MVIMMIYQKSFDDEDNDDDDDDNDDNSSQKWLYMYIVSLTEESLFLVINPEEYSLAWWLNAREKKKRSD